MQLITGKKHSDLRSRQVALSAGFTPFYAAARAGHLSVVRSLFDPDQLNRVFDDGPTIVAQAFRNCVSMEFATKVAHLDVVSEKMQNAYRSLVSVLQFGGFAMTLNL